VLLLLVLRPSNMLGSLQRVAGIDVQRSCRATQARAAQRVVCVATPSKPPATRKAKRSKVEIIKEKSDYLRHPLMEELVDEKSFIGEEAMQLMKFHGSYQQDHREKRAFGQGKFYQFMMRTRQPSGVVPNRLYLVMDDLADQASAASSSTPPQHPSQLALPRSSLIHTTPAALHTCLPDPTPLHPRH
jgi:hypothetical protein